MSVEQKDLVDFVSIVNETGAVRLTVSDHLKWDKDSPGHLVILQDKLNSYLRFIESGEIFQAYPEAKGRRIIIDVVCKYPPGEKEAEFVAYSSNLAREAGVELIYSQGSEHR